jgi:hypothetical protein
LTNTNKKSLSCGPGRKKMVLRQYILPRRHIGALSNIPNIKGIVSPDWKGLQMVSLDGFEV